MQDIPRAGGTSNDGRAAEARLFATFKLAAPYIEIVQKRDSAGEPKAAANVNCIGVVSPDHS